MAALGQSDLKDLGTLLRVRKRWSRHGIRRIYPAQQIKASQDDPDIITVTMADSPFSSVTYFITREGAQKGTISHISFDTPVIPAGFSDDFVYRKMLEAFGVPTEKERNFKWTVGAYALFSLRKDGYVLMKRGEEPVFWNI